MEKEKAVSSYSGTSGLGTKGVCVFGECRQRSEVGRGLSRDIGRVGGIQKWWREYQLQVFSPGADLQVGGWNGACPTITHCRCGTCTLAAARPSAAAPLAWLSARLLSCFAQIHYKKQEAHRVARASWQVLGFPSGSERDGISELVRCVMFLEGETYLTIALVEDDVRKT